MRVAAILSLTSVGGFTEASYDAGFKELTANTPDYLTGALSSNYLARFPPHWAVMGRKTWELMGPAPNCKTVVLSRSQMFVRPCEELVLDSFETALEMAREANVEKVFVVGGCELFRMLFERKLVEEAYVTRKYACFRPEQHIRPLEFYQYIVDQTSEWKRTKDYRYIEQHYIRLSQAS